MPRARLTSDVITIDQLAQTCNMPLHSMKRAIKDGRFPIRPLPKPIKPWVWRRDDVLEWLKTNTITQTYRVYPVLAISDVKLCSSCKEWKHVDNYYTDKKNKGGRASYCIPCQSAYNKNRPYKKQDPVYARNWRNQPEVRQRHRKNAENKYSDAGGRARILVSGAKNARAKKKDISCTLSVEKIEHKILSGFCERTGLPFDLKSKSKAGGNPLAPSIDRVDSAGHYTDENTQVVSMIYNLGKNMFDDITFIAMCCAVAERHSSDPAVKKRLKELRNAEF